jgi:lipopolysaccharide export LptBFGC system permease protein LptF
MAEDKQIKRVNFEDCDEDTGEQFMFEREESVQEEKEEGQHAEEEKEEKHSEQEAEAQEELSEVDKIRNLVSVLSKSVAFDEEDVALLTLKKAQLLKDQQKERTSTKALAKTHFQNTIDERETVLTDAVQRGLLIPGTETFLFFVRKQAKLVDLAQKLY